MRDAANGLLRECTFDDLNGVLRELGFDYAMRIRGNMAGTSVQPANASPSQPRNCD